MWPTNRQPYRKTSRQSHKAEVNWRHSEPPQAKHKRLCTRGKGERHERLPVSVGSSHKIYRKPGLLETRRNVSLRNERTETGTAREDGLFSPHVFRRKMDVISGVFCRKMQPNKHCVLKQKDSDVKLLLRNSAVITRKKQINFYLFFAATLVTFVFSRGLNLTASVCTIIRLCGHH